MQAEGSLTLGGDSLRSSVEDRVSGHGGGPIFPCDNLEVVVVVGLAPDGGSQTGREDVWCMRVGQVSSVQSSVCVWGWWWWWVYVCMSVMMSV
jgi:hypothetical protein